MRFAKKSDLLLFLGLVVWLFAIVVGLRFVLSYENRSGRSAISPIDWPEESRVPRTPGLSTMVLAVHPHCPCSRTSIDELAILMSQVQGLVSVEVLFVKPKDFPDQWEKTDLWSSAAMIPGVKPNLDEEGREAQRFGSETSGQVCLYSADGRLLFSGGITASRGHAGDSAGRDAIVSLLNRGSAQHRETPVFGCPLFAEDCNKQP